MKKVVCQGYHCPVKNQCANYAAGEEAETAITDGGRSITKCTNQKKFIKKQA